MTKYTYAQLEGLWINNGGPKAVAPLAAAIAMAESGGDSTATNHNTNGSTDRGLWQINSIWGSLSTYDPAANAKAAVQISHSGTNFGPWVTFTTGAYKQFMQGSTTPDLSVPGSSASASSSADSSSASAGPDCAWSIGGQHIGILFGHGPSLPSACVIRKTEVRALFGALILVGGALVIMPGLVIVMAYGFKASGAAAATLKAAQYVPGGGTAMRAARTAGAAYSRGGPQRPSKGKGPTPRPKTPGGRRLAAQDQRAPRGGPKKPVITDPDAGV